MLKKALTKSGRRILKVIKKISTARLTKKLQQQQQQQQLQREEKLRQQRANLALQARLFELEDVSSSLPSLDAKSVDTFVTYVADGILPEGFCYVPHCCCHCDEREENQRNENLENEMMR